MKEKQKTGGKHRKAKPEPVPKKRKAPKATKETTAKPAPRPTKEPKPQSHRQAVRELHAAEKKRAQRAKKGLPPEPVPVASPPKKEKKDKKRRKEKAPVPSPERRRPTPEPEILAQAEHHTGPSRHVRVRRRLFFLLLGLLLIVALLGSLYYFTGIFHVKDIEVTGCVHLNPDYIKALSGVSADSRFFGVNGGEVEKALKSEYWVESVSIKRELPLKLIIQVKERQPWASITMINRVFSVDIHGVVLEELPAVDPALPMIAGMTSRPVTPGDSVRDEAFDTCAGVLASMPQELNGRFSWISTTPSREINMATQEGMMIIYGTPTDEKTKNEAIRAVLQDPGMTLTSLEYLDVSVPDHPVIKPR